MLAIRDDLLNIVIVVISLQKSHKRALIILSCIQIQICFNFSKLFVIITIIKYFFSLFLFPVSWPVPDVIPETLQMAAAVRQPIPTIRIVIHMQAVQTQVLLAFRYQQHYPQVRLLPSCHPNRRQWPLIWELLP